MQVREFADMFVSGGNDSNRVSDKQLRQTELYTVALMDVREERDVGEISMRIS